LKKSPVLKRCLCSLSTTTGSFSRVKLTKTNSRDRNGLEEGLETFYDPTQSFSNTTVLKYNDSDEGQCMELLLPLVQRFEKAFLLSVDLGAYDLFMALDKEVN
uniref:Uncharacterized protein n=1 Tax=Terrapene triunguis TaxID=2587831 RepID=A0A674ITY4_9SAUR